MVDAADAWMCLHRTITGRGGSRVDRDYRLVLDTAAPPHGGRRW